MRAEFALRLEGPDLLKGAIEVRRLGPALVELGELCERANAVLNRDNTSVTVRLLPGASETTEGGRLRLSFSLRQRAEGKTPNLFPEADGAEPQRLLELLGWAPSREGMGLFELLRKLEGEAAPEGTPAPGERIRIELGGQPVEVPSAVYTLLRDAALRGRAEGFVRPLRRKGIERLTFEQGGRDACSLDRRELRYLSSGSRGGGRDEGETLVDSTYLRAMGIIKVPFRPNLKWVLGSDSERISADMADQKFLDRHQDGLTSYAAGDILTVRLRTTAVRTAAGLRTDHSIVEVVGHLRRSQEARQATLEEA